VIRVVLVDDHVIVRSGIRRMLEEGGEVEIVGEASDAAEAGALTRRLRPDVVVLDIGLRRSSGLDAIKDILEAGARVVVLTMQDEPAYAQRAFERGARAYVMKDAADEELLQAVRTVMEDGVYVHPSLAVQLLAGAGDDGLSEREREVLRLIALGHTNQEIAATLFLSVRTIESHRRAILAKLRLHTRADLVQYAMRHRLV
jgi:two-component system response regulator NreC